MGEKQVVDELLLRFTHNVPLAFMLPGVPPTDKPVELPVVVVMKFENGKIAHEHIYWDQGLAAWPRVHEDCFFPWKCDERLLVKHPRQLDGDPTSCVPAFADALRKVGYHTVNADRDCMRDVSEAIRGVDPHDTFSRWNASTSGPVALSCRRPT